MREIEIPNDLTYIGVFLTFRCNFKCNYCINRHGELKARKELTTNEWIKGLNRLKVDRELMVPITLSGGEPSKHKGFIDIIKGLNEDFYIDVLTNLDFDIDQFMAEIPPDRLQRDVPYDSIRVSYHAGQSDINDLFVKLFKMKHEGYSIGLFAVDHPDINYDYVKELSRQLGIDFRLKEFLGIWQNVLWGQYKYPSAINGELKHVKCKTTELLIAPDGNIHRCHRDLYYGENPLGNILDDDLKVLFTFKSCDRYGECSPCDIKLKNNRFQEFGACSVEIKK